MWEPIAPPALRGEPRRAPIGYILLPSPPAPLPRCGRGVQGRAAVPSAAHSPSPACGRVEHRCRYGNREHLQRVPPRPPAGEGDKRGEGNPARLPVHACAGKNSPCFKDFVPNRCTLTTPKGGCSLPPCCRGERPFAPTRARAERTARTAETGTARANRRRPYTGVFPALIRVHRLGSVCAGRARVRPHSQPLSHAVGEGSRARTCLEC